MEREMGEKIQEGGFVDLQIYLHSVHFISIEKYIQTHAYPVTDTQRKWRDWQTHMQIKRFGKDFMISWKKKELEEKKENKQLNKQLTN